MVVKSRKNHMCIISRMSGLVLICICILILTGCAPYKPYAVDEVPFRVRSQTKSEGNVRVTAAVPSAKESRKIFGVHIYKRGVQPIWLEIENNNEEPVWFLPMGLDPDYFSPIEAAFKNHFPYITPYNDLMNQRFYQVKQVIYIAPGRKKAGFVFAPVDEGTKELSVHLVGEDHQVRTFTFFINVPGLRVDHHNVDFDALYPEDEIVSLDEEGLRQALEGLDCCTTKKDGNAQGDPLNIVVIGESEDIFHTFIRVGWDETETIYAGSALKTIGSYLFGGQYRYSPVSGLYAFGRRQDVAFQRTRKSIHERNHLRLWLSPWRFEDKPVWVGQISRDIGVRFTWKTLTTHKISPDVDETRDFLIQDLLYAQGLEKIAYVKGVSPAPISNPRNNLTGDPYFTDGFRAVLWISSELTNFEEVELMNWEILPER
ncbi:MAG: LssY C-terminal domain-containing protein [Desulfobacteraceae bacterium]|nr:LssY C-terminal domain-containing protein [Desulfobacteraceae bacterium]